MGYLSWGTKPSKKGRAGSHGGEERKPAAAATMVAAAAAGGGCINAVLHMFDFQRFHLCLHPQLDHHDYPPQPPPIQPTTTSFALDHHHPISPKGVEAPRNSLEAEEIVTGPPSLASIMGDQKDDTLHIPVGIEINTSRRDTRLKLVQAPRGKYNNKHQEDIPTSESSNSPGGGARTPGLVARLMGLDILPESLSSTTTTPRSSVHTPQTAPPRKATRAKPTTTSYDNFGPHSLPETPRRLSLQINKENSIVREMESSRPSCSAISTKRKEGKSANNYEEESRSPGYYARQIMKQVRETVSRRVGVDITNTINNGGQRSELSRRDENLLTLSTKPKKPNKLESNTKLKNSDPSSKLSSLNSENAKPEALQVLSMAVKPPPKPSEEEKEKEKKKLGSSESCSKKKKKNHPMLYDSIRNKKDEQFVRPPLTNKKSKKTPLSSDLFHGSVPSVVPLKKDSSKLIHKQGSSSKAQPSKAIISKSSTTNTSTSTSTGAQLSRTPSQQIYERLEQTEATHVPAVQVIRKTKDSNSITEFQYISRILKCTGIDRDTPVTLARWFSSSHPLDPSIFHNLEGAHYVHQHPSFRISNRRLIFHLVDEILADLLKPYVRLRSRMFGHTRQYSYNDHQQIYGFQLVKILCTRIRSFPSADCQTLQDIDALVEKDLPRTGVQSNVIALEEEGDAIVSEIERDILDTLVHEIAVFCLGSSRSRSSCSMQRYVGTIRV